MKNPFEQPFKSITLAVSVEATGKQVGTNDGMIDKSRIGKTGNNFNYPGGPDSIILKNDARYSPIRMKADGYAELAKDGTKPIIGVLMESFEAPLKSHNIMVEGIVPMQVSSADIKPGDLVTASAAKTGAKVNTKRTRIAKATTGNYPFGIALQKPSAEGDWISVLIGTTGGKL